tara:strand:+ start:426 stop:800 length:375 start_codon:yes stop_codon:yes gene_type:complete
MNTNAVKSKPVTIAGVEYPSISKAVFPTGLSFSTISAARAAGTLGKLVPRDSPKVSSPSAGDLNSKLQRQLNEAHRQLETLGEEHSKHLDQLKHLANQRDRYRDECKEYDITLRTLIKCISGGN